MKLLDRGDWQQKAACEFAVKRPQFYTQFKLTQQVYQSPNQSICKTMKLIFQGFPHMFVSTESKTLT